MVERMSGRGQVKDQSKDKSDAPAAARSNLSAPKKTKAAVVGKESAAKSAAKPGFTKKTIALVYDFDGTLSPKPRARTCAGRR